MRLTWNRDVDETSRFLRALSDFSVLDVFPSEGFQVGVAKPGKAGKEERAQGFPFAVGQLGGTFQKTSVEELQFFDFQKMAKPLMFSDDRVFHRICPHRFFLYRHVDEHP